MRPRLPLGIQTFSQIREGGHYYVDKTALAGRLAAEGKHYFLSRPRRFGKSLFVDTLKELFEGNEALFEGLAVHAGWDWSVRRPVVRLDFSGGHFTTPDGLQENLFEQLDALEQEMSVEPRYGSAPGRFRHLIRTLHRRAGQRVAVLVDEYDKPILDALGTPELAHANRDLLRSVYGNLKACDADVAFSFLTGVSRFSKVNLFSDVNNLTDITLDRRYATVCGYTDTDLDAVFAPELAGFDRAAIRDWYNGYDWLGEKVYNPYDILRLFDTREFGAHWFATGRPAFLIETLIRRNVGAADLDGAIASADLLAAFDVDRIVPQALLFQSGYLTITGVEARGGKTHYRLGYPNREVRESLNESLLDHLIDDPAGQQANAARLYDLLQAGDASGLRELFHAFFASIPHQWHTRNDLARYEGYYASVVYAWFAGLRVDVTVEDSTSRGRLDMAVCTGGRVYLFEFKVVEQAGDGAALAQLKTRGYAEKYRQRGEPIMLVGVEFSRQTRNVTAFDVEVA